MRVFQTEEWQKDAVYEAEHDAFRLKDMVGTDTYKYIKDGAMWLDVGKPTERLAGAIITLMDGVRNVVEWGFSLEDALTMATLTPAQNLGVDDGVGSIAPEKAADVVIVDDDLKVQKVILRGKVIL